MSYFSFSCLSLSCVLCHCVRLQWEGGGKQTESELLKVVHVGLIPRLPMARSVCLLSPVHCTVQPHLWPHASKPQSAGEVNVTENECHATDVATERQRVEESV